jgi:hypothetical protein
MRTKKLLQLIPMWFAVAVVGWPSAGASATASSVAHAAALAAAVDFEELAMSVAIPEGYRERPDFAMGNPDVLAVYVETEPFNAEEHLVVWVQRMRDVVEEGWIDIAASSQGTQTRIVTWRGLKLPVVRVPNNAGGLRRTQVTTTVPLTPEAIQLGLTGPTEREEELTAVMEQLIAGTEGETNWQAKNQLLPIVLAAVLALIIGAAGGFILGRIRQQAE